MCVILYLNVLIHSRSAFNVVKVSMFMVSHGIVQNPPTHTVSPSDLHFTLLGSSQKSGLSFQDIEIFVNRDAHSFMKFSMERNTYNIGSLSAVKGHHIEGVVVQLAELFKGNRQ